MSRFAAGLLGFALAISIVPTWAGTFRYQGNEVRNLKDVINRNSAILTQCMIDIAELASAVEVLDSNTAAMGIGNGASLAGVGSTAHTLID